MTSSGTFKVAVYIDSFKNIELFKQGVYQLRLSLLHENSRQSVVGKPVRFQDFWAGRGDWKKVNPACVIRPHILDEAGIYCTKSLLIRYQEEEFPIKELCVFSIDLPLDMPGQLKLVTELMFTNMEGKPPKRPTFRALNRFPHLECLKQSSFVVQPPFHALVQYLPITFDPDHFCMYDSLLAVHLEDYTHLSPSLFGAKQLVGGAEINKVFYATVDPLRVVYDEFSLMIEDLVTCKFAGNATAEALKLAKLPKTSDTFYERIRSHQAAVVSQFVHDEVQLLSNKIHRGFANWLDLINLDSAGVLSYFSDSLTRRISKRFQQFIKIETKPAVEKVRRHTADNARRVHAMRGVSRAKASLLGAQQESLFDEMAKQPLFLVESYADQSCMFSLDFSSAGGESCPILDTHLLVLVHGYKGTSMDMHMLKAYISSIYPKLCILSAKSVEHATDSNILELGRRLAEEVLSYLNRLKIPLHRLKLSFLSHSMGGLVIRAALPYLQRYKECMWSLLSLSTPHLGVSYGEGVLFNLGVSLLQAAGSSVSFHQMTLNDSSDLEESFIYKLSEFEGLNWFENVVLFSCGSDPYITEESAGLSIPLKALGTDKQPFFEKVLDNILNKVEPRRLLRVDVHFREPEVLANCICCGNQHIDFLDNPSFIKTMCYGMPGLFI